MVTRPPSPRWSAVPSRVAPALLPDAGVGAKRRGRSAGRAGARLAVSSRRPKAADLLFEAGAQPFELAGDALADLAGHEWPGPSEEAARRPAGVNGDRGVSPPTERGHAVRLLLGELDHLGYLPITTKTALKREQPMSLLAVTREAGPSWTDRKGDFEQPAANDHAAFMSGLADKGFVMFARPLAGSETRPHPSSSDRGGRQRDRRPAPSSRLGRARGGNRPGR